jgi:dCMP deaminase
MRPSWDESFFNIAEEISKRSTCLRRQYGCVIVRNNHIISSGYNGPPKGCKHCDELGGCRRAKYKSGTHHELCRAAHAEQNAIALAAREGISVNHSELYIRDIPCIICAKIIINAGIDIVHFKLMSYPDWERSVQMFEEAGVKLVEYNGK